LLRAGEPRLGLDVRLAQLRIASTFIQGRAVCLASQLEVARGGPNANQGGPKALVRGIHAPDGCLLLRRPAIIEIGRGRVPYDVVDLLVCPHSADQQEDRENYGEELLAFRRLDVLDVDCRAHFESPRFVLGLSSTISSQSSASAMRRSVSIRGGRPPDSSCAIADCAVPVSSAYSF